MTLYTCPACQTEQVVRRGQRWCAGCQASIPDVDNLWEAPPPPSINTTTPPLRNNTAPPPLAQAGGIAPRPRGLILIVCRYTATVLVILWSLGSLAWAIGQDVNRHPENYYVYVYNSAGTHAFGPAETAKALLPLLLPFACLGLGVVVVGLVLVLTLWKGAPAGWVLGVMAAIGDAVLSAGSALFVPDLMPAATAVGAVLADLAIFIYLLRPNVRAYFF